MKTALFSLIILFTLSASMAFAQETDDSKTSFAILGGINFQNLNGKDMSGDKLDNDILIGFHAGLNVQFPIAPEFYLQPGLIFSTKGAKNTEGSSSNTYKLSYIEMPLNFVYKAQLGKGYIMLGFGPYLAYAIGGTATHEGDPVSVEKDIEFTNEVESGDPHTTTYMKPFDSGANLFFGYELPSGLFLQLNTQLGLIEINPEDKRFTDDNKTSIKNTGYGLSLGYRF